MKRWLPILTLILLPWDALAEVPDMNDAPVVRNRLMWREGRFELSPGIGMTLNDRYFRNILFNLGANYHVNNWFGFGLSVGYGVPLKTSLTENIESEKSIEGYSYAVPATHLGLLAGVSVSVVPLYGKLLLPGDIALSYDLHLNGGVGLMQVVWNSDATDRLAAEDQWEFSPNFGGGLRVFLDSGVALSFDVMDRMASTYTAARGDFSVPPESWSHSVSFMLSVSIFMPYRVMSEE